MQKSPLYVVYRWFFSHVTGRLCPANVARGRTKPKEISAYFLIVTLTMAAVVLPQEVQGQISLPPPPTAVPPPAIPEDKDPAILRRKEKAAAKEEAAKSQRKALVEKAEVEREVAAKEELSKPRPLYGFIEISMHYPKILTSGERKDYVGNVTNHVNFWSRLKYDTPADETQVWAGFRLAPFGGTGVQGSDKGRFAMTYFGPSLGFGKVGVVSDSTSDSPSRNGWLIGAGVAAVSILGHPDEIYRSTSTDFKSTPVGFDSPGGWIEGRFMHVFHGAISGNLIIGSQLGNGKNFIYSGFGLGGWL